MQRLYRWLRIDWSGEWTTADPFHAYHVLDGGFLVPFQLDPTPGAVPALFDLLRSDLNHRPRR